MGIMKERYIDIYNSRAKMQAATLGKKRVKGYLLNCMEQNDPLRYTVELYTEKVSSVKAPVLNCFLL